MSAGRWSDNLDEIAKNAGINLSRHHTRQIVVPRLEKTDLKLESDFLLAYSPERGEARSKVTGTRGNAS